MVERFLKGKDVKYLVDSDGDFQVRFGYDDDWGCGLDIWLTIQGQDADVYTIRAHADRRVPRDQWGQAIMMCNTWNCEKRWPKAYLHVGDAESDSTGEIILEEQLDTGDAGIHQELLDHLTLTIIAGCHLFWTWAHQEQGF